MAKHFTTKQKITQAIEYATRIGLQGTLVGLGFGLFFGPYFLTGVVLFCLGLLLLVVHLMKQLFIRHLQRWSKVTLCIISVTCLGLLSWSFFRAVPIQMKASASVPLYGAGTNINGIPWQKQYSEFHLTVVNRSSIDYDNLDIALTTDLTFAALRQVSGLASCNIAPEGEPFDVTSQLMTGGVPNGPADTSGEHDKVVALDKNGRILSISGGINQMYRIRCDKFPAHSVNTFVGALVMLNKFVDGKVPSGLFAAPQAANQFTAVVKFATLGRPRSLDILNCPMASLCGN